MDRAAGAKIVMVGTHCDLCSKEDVQVSEFSCVFLFC